MEVAEQEKKIVLSLISPGWLTSIMSLAAPCIISMTTEMKDTDETGDER